MQDTAFALIVNTSTSISFFIHWDDYQCCDVILSDMKINYDHLLEPYFPDLYHFLFDHLIIFRFFLCFVCR